MKNVMKELLVKPKPKSDFDAGGLAEKIMTGYVKNKETSKHMKKRSFAPSSLVYGNGACPRYWYIAFDGATFDSEREPTAVANMENGTLSHGRIQEAMKNAGVLAEAEVKLDVADPPIRGFMDALIEYKKQQIPGEIKTMREESFQYRKTANAGAKYHIEQLLIYMKILSKKRGVLIYESKNTHELLIIPVDMTEEYEEWVNELWEWMRTVRKAWEEKTIPQKPYRSNSKVCKTCPVQKTCSKLPKGELKINPKRALD